MGFLLFTFLLFQTIHAQNGCRSQYCGSNPLPIRFPFMLQEQNPQNCGYPEFVLTCSAQEDSPVLTLPHGGNFSVRGINYLMQEIILYDPNGCLPRKLVDLDLTSSPFEATYGQSFTFLSCPRDTRLATVDCLSNSTAAVVATSSASLVKAMNTCSTMFTLPAPLSWSADDWLSSRLSGDLTLTWSVPDCQGCEAQGGVCTYDHRNSTTGSQIMCYFDLGAVLGEDRGLEIFKVIALSIVIPTIISSIAVSFFVCIVERRAARRRNASIAAAPAAQAQTSVGLDESTIESYTKVVIGESKRLPGPNGGICPICLVDYYPKDTVRCIPECQHCFHSDCVDEWLRLNSSCPVCRNSPKS